nr:alpha/beta-hydrolase family protein [Paracoccaceae bacterium]
YVGREEADTPEDRTEAALAEMDRVGAFDRAVLVLATPTGTGWLDPGSHDVVEFLHDGDVVTVAVQYSYLTSAVALLFETNTGLEQAASLFNEVYDRWAAMPEDDRPRLYLHGISLGSWASMYSLDPFRMLGDPVDGAFWVGPPFPSDLWRRASAARDEGSPFVLPEVDDGRMVRFTNGRAPVSSEGWGPFRVLYLQHGSDGIVFYDPASAWRRPAWLEEPPAPDVSPLMRWTPIVTMVQLALDMALSKLPPPGYGHNYAADEYVRGWIAVSDPLGWDEAAIRRLEERCGPTLDSGCME